MVIFSGISGANVQGSNVQSRTYRPPPSLWRPRQHYFPTSLMKCTLRLLANDEQTRFKYKHDSCCIGNESVPIQLAQCWFSGLAFLTLKYKYIHRRNFVCGDGDLSPPLLKVVVTVTTTCSKWNLQLFKQF